MNQQYSRSTCNFTNFHRNGKLSNKFRSLFENYPRYETSTAPIGTFVSDSPNNLKRKVITYDFFLRNEKRTTQTRHQHLSANKISENH